MASASILEDGNQNGLKLKNILQNNKVVFIVDDLISANPRTPVGLEVKGIAEILRGDDYVKIVPLKKSRCGLDERSC
jgi:hypothetical protein